MSAVLKTSYSEAIFEKCPCIILIKPPAAILPIFGKSAGH
jgi:hypothetical protein